VVNDFLVRLSIRSAMFAGAITGFVFGLFGGATLGALISWFAGAIYDHFGYYAPAFGVGVVFNLANLLIVGFLVFRLTGPRRTALWPAIG